MAKAELTIGAPRYHVLNAFMRTRARCAFIMGPLGSGKTFGAVQRILAQMCEQEPNELGVRPTRWCAIRNTYPDLMTTTVRDFEAVFSGLGKMKYGGLEPPTFHVHFKLKDGTQVKGQVIFLALDRVDSVKKLRGTQVTGFWLNETKELVKPIVDMADLRHGRYPTVIDGGVACSWHGMIGDCNACDEDHWYYKLAEEDHPQGWEFYRQPGGLVPTDKTGVRIVFEANEQAENLDNLPEDYYRRGQEAKSDDWILVNLANEYGFTIDGKPVHPEYLDSVHTAKETLETDLRYPLIIGVDFGRTPAAAIGQYLEHIGRWVILDELCSQDMSAAIFGPELKRYLDRNYSGMKIQAWGDPAGEAAGQATEDTPILIIRAAGIPIQPCDTNSPSLRRAAIAGPAMRMCMDGRPALLVSPKAKMIRKALMGGFCYRRMKISDSEKYTEEPDKNIYSHPAEATEYMLMGGGEGREALKPALPRYKGPVQTQAIMEQP
ncbi:MAG: hypothetical protein V3R16_02365 [Nitrospirales bacterium]